MKNSRFDDLHNIAKAGYSYPDMAVDANVSQKQNPSPSFKTTKKVMATAFRGATKPAPLPKSASASPSFDMESFNKENPVIEGKEFEPVPQTRRKMPASKKVGNADTQANKMKSVKKAIKVSKRKGILTAMSPNQELKAKQGERAARQHLDPKNMSFADATVHLNSGKLRNQGWHPPSVANQKHDAGIKRDFHHLLRQTSHTRQMPLPKSFVIPTGKQLKKAKTCWSCDEKPAVTTHEGHPLCNGCMDHFVGAKSKPIKDSEGRKFSQISAAKSVNVLGGKLAKADIGYIEKHYSGKHCAKCHDPLTEENADIHSATYGERHHKGALCKSCCSKMRD